MYSHRNENKHDPNETEKGRGLTQSCDKNPYTHRKVQKAT